MRVRISAATLAAAASTLIACGPPSEKSTARHAIDLCWEDQKRKSLDPATQRFVASTCEKMERDFFDRYHVKP